MEKVSLEDIDSIVERINSIHLLGKLYKIQIRMHVTKAEVRTVKLEIILTSIGSSNIVLKKNLIENEAYIFLLGFEKGLSLLHYPALQW